MRVLERLHHPVGGKRVIERRTTGIEGRLRTQAGTADQPLMLLDGAHRAPRPPPARQLGTAVIAEHSAAAPGTAGKTLLGQYGVERTPHPATPAKRLI